MRDSVFDFTRVSDPNTCAILGGTQPIRPNIRHWAPYRKNAWLQTPQRLACEWQTHKLLLRTCVHIFTDIYLRTHSLSHTHTHMHLYIYTYSYYHTSASTACSRKDIYRNMYMYTYTNVHIYIYLSIDVYKYICNKNPWQLEASFLIFLTLGSIKQSDTRTLQTYLLKKKCIHMYLYLYVYIYTYIHMFMYVHVCIWYICQYM